MTQKSALKPSADSSGKVLVFGICDDDKPHVAWFPKTQTDAARVAAKQLRLNVIEVANGNAADVIANVPPGRIHAPGTGMVPVVGTDLYEKVIATVNPRGEAGQTPDTPVVTDLPASFTAIKPGHLVLTHESLIDGWWEAIVLDRRGDKVTLRMRDYPAYGKFTVPVTAVALLNPDGAH